VNRFLALGDSYTIGEGVSEEERWPNQLARTLRSEGLALENPEIVARTGWTTGELAAAMHLHVFQPPYALVTLLVGVNDQYRAGQPHRDAGADEYSSRTGRALDTYRQEFRNLLERAIGLAGGHTQRVLVVSIPDWGVTPFARDSGRDPATIAHELDG
jgi:lysophospholipase L1-like esterase